MVNIVLLIAPSSIPKMQLVCLSSISIPILSHSCIPSCQWAGVGITNDPSDFNANRIIVALPQ